MNKVDYEQFIDLNNTVSSLSSSMNRIGEVIGLKNDITKKANDKDLKELNNRVIHLQELMDQLVNNNVPNDLILEKFKMIESELSILSGKISVLENIINNM